VDIGFSEKGWCFSLQLGIHFIAVEKLGGMTDRFGNFFLCASLLGKTVK
jgi:hypothetical protein